MTLWIAIGVGLAGAIGTVCRFVVDSLVSSRFGAGLPAGTTAVNLSGALILGVLVGVGTSGDAMRLVETGAIGGYTTFSTWTLESHRLAEDGSPRIAAMNFILSSAAGVVLVWAGREIGAVL